MTQSIAQPSAPPAGKGSPPTPYLTITPPTGWAPINLREIWAYRDMIWRLTLRDIKSRYKQSALGPTWVIIIPLFSAGLFSVIFGALAGLPSGDIPYPVFVYTGMLVWGQFSRGFGQTAGSIAASENLISKVYFPRLVAPLAGLAGSILDLLLGIAVLVVLLAIAGIVPPVQVVLAPLYIVFAMVAAMASGIWIAALSVKLRDLRYAASFFTQTLMWLTPVAYSSEIVFNAQNLPERLQPTIEALFQLNPCFQVVEGFRWSVLGHTYGQPTIWTLYSVLLTLVVLIVGMFYFRRIDATVADVI